MPGMLPVFQAALRAGCTAVLARECGTLAVTDPADSTFLHVLQLRIDLFFGEGGNWPSGTCWFQDIASNQQHSPLAAQE